MNTESTNKTRKKARPLRRAQRWQAQVLPMAGKLLAILIAATVVGLMFSALQAVDMAWLRIALSLLIASGLLLMHYSEGVTRGTADAGASVFYESASARGAQLTDRDDAACYHPMKAVCAAIAVYGVPLALAVYIAATAQPYTYALQDLPAWLTDTYGARADVMAPLGAYAARAGMAVRDWVRVLVRLPQMIYLNLFSDPLTMSAAIDRLAPALMCTFPLAYVIGYLCGPSQERKRRQMNRRAKKVAVRRAQKSSLASELTGEQNRVHYGQRVQDEKHRKKELV